MSEELAGILVAAGIDGLVWLLFRGLRASSEAELDLLRGCKVAQEGRSARDLLKAAGVNELPRVALSGVLAPHADSEVVVRDGRRSIAFRERHAQVGRDGKTRRELFAESRVPDFVALRRLSSWTFGVTGPTEERINLRSVKHATGFNRLFRPLRDHRVPLADSSSGDYFHIAESAIPAGLTLNFLGSLSYDPISQQLNMHLLNIGFTDMQELIDSAKSAASFYRFISSVCRVTTLCLLAYAGHRAYRLYRERRRKPPHQPPPPPPPPSSSGGDSQPTQPSPRPPPPSGPADVGETCGVCFDRPPRTVLIDCGHALCKSCAAAVLKCPFCSRPKVGQPVQLFVP